MTKIIKIFSTISGIIFYLSWTTKALAFCPVCTAGVALGLGLSRWLGVDDTISGLWIGALLIALIFWTLNWLKNKHWNFRGDKLVIALIFYSSVLIPLYKLETINHPLNKIWGTDKLIFGMTIGGLAFLLGFWLHTFLKSKNHNQSYFPFQKVIIPISPLIILSIIFFFITRG